MPSQTGGSRGFALLFEGNPAAAGLLTELDTFLPKYPEVGVFFAQLDTVEALFLAGRRTEAEDRVQRLSDAARPHRESPVGAGDRITMPWPDTHSGERSRSRDGRAL